MLRLHGYGKKKNVHKCLTLVIKFYYRIHALRKKICIKKKKHQLIIFIYAWVKTPF